MRILVSGSKSDAGRNEAISIYKNADKVGWHPKDLTCSNLKWTCCFLLLSFSVMCSLKLEASN